MSSTEHHLAQLFEVAIRSVLPLFATPAVAEFERPRDAKHGDFACNIAMRLAKSAGRHPRELAQALIAALPASEVLASAELAGPGFINLRLSTKARAEVVAEVLQQGAAYGRSNIGQGRKLMVEFVSANPTGPLHVGHGRGAAVGDALSRLFDATGWQVTREFYYNDAGVQIANLTLSVQARIQGLTPEDAAWPEGGYRGEYIADIARDYVQHHPADPEGMDADAVRLYAVALLREEQDRDLTAFRVAFDSHFLESSLYANGDVAATVAALIASGHTYEADGALWLCTTEFGDDKDRVMRKQDGEFTYFLPDVAYHVKKWQRGFVRVVNEQGSDHHSTITRVRAGLQALNIGIPKNYPDYVLHQMVLVMKDGEEMKFSKRAGSYVTLRDLIELAGVDATRYFFVMRKSDSQLTFDIDLARAQSEENPVYYLQYAHARICSVLRQADLAVAEITAGDPFLLTSPFEAVLLNRLSDFPHTVAIAAEEMAPHSVAHYLKEVAADFHAYYNAERFLVEDAALQKARLGVIAATSIVLKNGLALLGVSAPEQM